MANEKDTTDNEKIPMQTRVDSSLHKAVSNIAVADDRSLSNTIERLLKSHPQVRPLLALDNAEAIALTVV